MRKIIVYLVIAFTIMSCNKKPVFLNMGNLVIESVEGSKMIAKMDYVIYNPNSVKSKLQQSKMKIHFHDTIVGKGYTEHQVMLYPKDTIAIPIKLEINLEQLSKFYPLLIKSDSTAFHIEGDSKIGVLLNSFSIDVNEIIYIDTKKTIQKEINKNLNNSENFKIVGVSINSTPTFTQSSFKINIETKNNLPFDYEVDQMKLTFYNSNTPVAKWQLEQPFKQEANNTAIIPIKVDVDNLSMIKQTNLSWFLKREMEFEVKGNANIIINKNKFNVPIEDKIKLKLNILTGIFE